MRRLRLAILLSGIAGTVTLLAGPVSSGALLLLVPPLMARVTHDLPASYVPLHKGHVDLGTGLYLREDEDLVVPGTPALVLRRTYLANYRVSREFGVGATHDGEDYLSGDGGRFQRASLILASGTAIPFTRTSPGSSFVNAMFQHDQFRDGWQRARLGWTGGTWALRRTDGRLSIFRGCGGDNGACSIVSDRDEDGHVTQYRRDARGQLLRIEADRRWIAFDYDTGRRVSRAYDSAGRVVRYAYDNAGRLIRVIGHDGAIRRYGYTAQDQLATIVEPGTDIENIYDAAGRCIRQVNHFPGEPGTEDLVFTFRYHVSDGRVTQATSIRSDQTWQDYTFAGGAVTSETWGRTGVQPAHFTYERDTATNAVTSMTVTCPDRRGLPLRHTSIVRDGDDASVKWDILQTHCSWRRAAEPSETVPAEAR